MLLLFAVLGPLHILTKALFGRSAWPRRFLAAVAWVAGARPRLDGEPIRGHTLLLSNHISWLDIVVLGGSTDCAFVAKDELGHPLIHWLADQNATVYVKRSHRKGTKDQALAVAQALQGDKPVTIFPEATTGPGTHLLPFRSALLEAANFAARDVSIRPIALDYGDAAGEIAWWHQPGMDNVMRLLSRPDTLPVTIHVLEPLERGSDRKQLAHEARRKIAESLGLTSHAHSPIGSDK